MANDKNPEAIIADLMAKAGEHAAQSARFKEAARAVAEAYGVAIEAQTEALTTDFKITGAKPDNFMAVEAKDTKLKRGDRLEQLKQFLKANGATSRGQIVAKTGIPVGTISFLLNKKDIFANDESGKWKLVEEDAA